MKQIKMVIRRMVINAINDWEDTEFYIEICHTERAATAYHQGSKLPNCKKATGYGYNKESTCLAHALNSLTSENLADSMNSGRDFVIAQAAEHGIKIEHIAPTKSGTLYKFTNLNAKVV